MARAVYMMFLISETHPFDDGNGRVARMMMNAELFHAGEAKIIVPTVCREDYLLALRKLSRQKDPSAYLKVMDMLHRFTATLYGRATDEMLQYLYKCNAFSEADEQYLKF
jgi:Fic family protein